MKGDRSPWPTSYRVGSDIRHESWVQSILRMITGRTFRP